ncbi:MAG: tRNA (N(6)-L-threonylcarbamoyladenosine(37)-C(2))-methylthiotransferase MtaB, partial [Peptococcaceae bacterium]|nr:tRNA (N(6)-L-threonylcarbamoyladenosine(37)-C(2))-methylthiotransferase MtaB [Peptococcaceae bacterium]
MKAAFYTLGCKVNQTETEAITAIFRNGGYEVVPSEEQADVYVINTCTVTNMGDRKSRQIIRRVNKTNPAALVVVMGCYAQVSPDEVSKIPGVDLVLGTKDRGRILELLAQVRQAEHSLSLVQDDWRDTLFEELPMLETETRVRATLKIEEGCNQFCTYCIIPYARGPVRSRQPDRALAEAAKLVHAGYKEVVLTGIHTGAYGQDLGLDLNYLVSRMADLPGLERLRLSSIEPVEFSADLIATIAANPNICPHLHVPLQSGCDQTLLRMRRPYDTEVYAAIIANLREAIPRVAITTDLIVGFPGETDAEHRASWDFARRMEFAAIHVFKYSPRRGTPAADYPNQVAATLKEARSKEFHALSRENWRRYAEGFLGETMPVLVEQAVADGKWEGHTANYLPVRFNC